MFTNHFSVCAKPYFYSLEIPKSDPILFKAIHSFSNKPLKHLSTSVNDGEGSQRPKFIGFQEVKKKDCLVNYTICIITAEGEDLLF